MIDDAELWGTDKQAVEEAKRARKNARRHNKDSCLPPRHKKVKAPRSTSATPLPRSGGSQGTEPFSDAIHTKKEASNPARALHRSDWSVHESDHSSEAWVATQLIQGLPTPADMKRAANLTSETLEACYCQGLVQGIVAQNELWKRMARNSRQMLELDVAITDCHNAIKQKNVELKAQHDRVAELETRLKELEISRHAVEEKLGNTQAHLRELEEKYAHLRELEEKYADPTQLPEVKGYIRRELQGVWKKGFLQCQKEVRRAHPNFDFSSMKSLEDVIADLTETSSTRTPAEESVGSNAE